MKLLYSVLLLLASVQLSVADSAVVKRFDAIKSLVGEWNAVLPDGKSMKITYESISGGAILEIYHSEDPMWWNMSTVYHLDKDQILMNHYCSWGNHPRMGAKVAKVLGKTKNQLNFDFIDLVTTQPDKGFMKNLTVEFIDDNTINHHWVWSEKNKDLPLTLKLSRI